MNSKRRLVRTTPNHAFESGPAVKRRAAQRERQSLERDSSKSKTQIPVCLPLNPLVGHWITSGKMLDDFGKSSMALTSMSGLPAATSCCIAGMWTCLTGRTKESK